MRTAAKQVVFVAVAITAVVGLQASAFAQGCPCVVPDNGAGTVTVPPNCVEGYQAWMVIDDGLVGATVDIDATLFDFSGVLEIVGGGLGGTQSAFDAVLRMEMSGTGSLAGFARTINMPVAGVIDWGPRVLDDAVQAFSGEILELQGDIFGDPDFDALMFRSGSDFGLPGSGPTTLTRLGPVGSDFQVDSFFDIAYEIEFQGAAGSVLDGLGGTTNRLTRFQTCPGGGAPVEDASWGTIKALYR